MPSVVTHVQEPAAPIELQSVFDCGFEAARAIEAREDRESHLSAWLLRLSRVDPATASELPDGMNGDVFLGATLLTRRAQFEAEAGARATDLHWRDAVRRLELLEQPGLRLDLFNDLCETAIGVGEDDRGRALGLLASLGPIAEQAGSEYDGGATKALACALLGEAMLVLGDPAGVPYLEVAEGLTPDLGNADQILAFLSQTHAARDPHRAMGIVRCMRDAGQRLNARLAVLERASDVSDEVFLRMLDEAAGDVHHVEEMRRVEALARIAARAGVRDPKLLRQYFEQALGQMDGMPAQMRALQLAGTAAAVWENDESWARAIYEQSLAAARDEPEAARRVVALIAIAYQMGHTDPGTAQSTLNDALDQASNLEAMWETAHVLDVLLDTRGRPDLDLSAALQLLEASVGRVSADEPRLPGVFGLPEVVRAFSQLDSDRAAMLALQWFESARDRDENDGVLDAALWLARLDPLRGDSALREVLCGLIDRNECVGISHFCGAVAEFCPELVAEVALRLPESKERTRSLAAAMAANWSPNPLIARRLLTEIPEATERSGALLTLVDRCLGTGEMERPYSESQFSSCCSQIPQLDAETMRDLRDTVTRC